MQSSKGLEFRSVIFIGLGQIETSETQAAQNMKLLYVGMTRAKERLNASKLVICDFLSSASLRISVFYFTGVRLTEEMGFENCT